MTILQIPTTLLQKYYYGCTTGLQTTGYYSYYGHYRFRGKIPWFADEQTSEVIVIEIKPGNPLTSKK